MVEQGLIDHSPAPKWVSRLPTAGRNRWAVLYIPSWFKYLSMRYFEDIFYSTNGIKVDFRTNIQRF